MENLEKILKETEGFFYVDDEKITKLAEELTEHMNNKLYFNPTPLKVNVFATFLQTVPKVVGSSKQPSGLKQTKEISL